MLAFCSTDAASRMVLAIIISPIAVFALEFLSIVSEFGWIFDLPRDSDGFNVKNSDFTNDFGLKKSGLNGEYDFDTISAEGNTQAPLFEFNDTRSGLRDFNITGNVRVFGLVFNGYKFNNEMNSVMDIYFNDNALNNEYYYATSGMFIFDIFCFLFMTYYFMLIEHSLSHNEY